MSIEIQCMTENLIVITIKLDYSKVPSKSTEPTYAYKAHLHNIKKAKAKDINIKCKKTNDIKKAKLQSKVKGLQTTTFKKSLTTTYSKQEEDAQCIYCWEKYSETSHDGIIQCTVCLNWAHF